MAKKQKILERDNTLFLIPVLIILLVAPTIVYMRAVEQSEIAQSFWRGSKVTYDFFCYYKTLTLRLFACIGIIFFLTQKFLYGFKFRFNKIFIPYIVFLCFGLISSIFSDYQEFAWLGFPDRFEGYLSIISYALIMYMTYDLAGHEKSRRAIISILIFLAALLSLIGLFQYWGMDFFQTTFGKELILPEEFESAAGRLSFHQYNPVYMTLYQSNFAGTYTSMMFPMSCLGIWFFQGWKKIFMIGLNFLLFFVWVACASRAGMFGGVVALTAIFWFLRYDLIQILKKKWWLAPAYLAAYVLLLYLVVLKPGNDIFNRYMPPKEVTPVASSAPNQPAVVVPTYQLKNIVFTDKSMLLETTQYTITVKENSGSLSFFSENNQQLVVKFLEKGIIAFESPQYKSVIFRMIRGPKGEMIVQYVHEGQGIFALTVEKGRLIYYDLARKKAVEPTPLVPFFNRKYDKAASSRFYIWTGGISVLMDSLFIGKGFDTFPAVFPQFDYVGKRGAFGSTNIIIEKPHNWFLDIGISSGVLGLISFLLFLFYYFKQFLTSFSIAPDKMTGQLNFVLMIGVLGYLASGLFNDSIVSIEVIFWIMLGLSLRLTEELQTNK